MRRDERERRETRDRETETEIETETDQTDTENSAHQDFVATDRAFLHEISDVREEIPAIVAAFPRIGCDHAARVGQRCERCDGVRSLPF